MLLILLLVAAAGAAAERTCGTALYFANLTYGPHSPPFVYDLSAPGIIALDISMPEAALPSSVPRASHDSLPGGSVIYSFVTDENLACPRSKVIHMYTPMTDTVETLCAPNMPNTPMQFAASQMITALSLRYSVPSDLYTTWFMVYAPDYRRSARLSARTNKNDAAYTMTSDMYAYFVGGGGAGLVSYDGGSYYNWDCPTNTLERCGPFPDSGACTTLTPAPAPIGNGVAVIYGDYVHVIGGNVSCGLTASAAIYSYSITNDEWDAVIPAMPEGRVGHSAIVYEDVLYVAGGYVTWERTLADGPPAPAITYPACEVIAYNFTEELWHNVLCGGLRLSLTAVAPLCQG